MGIPTAIGEVIDYFRHYVIKVTQHPEQFVLFKLWYDAFVMTLFFPLLMTRMSHVYGVCPSVWLSSRCDAQVWKQLHVPMFVYALAVFKLLGTYYMFYTKLKAAIRTTSVEDVEEKHVIYSYLAILLFVHMYISFAGIVFIYSMNISHMIVLVAFGIVQDIWIIKRIMLLRRKLSFALSSNSKAATKVNKVRVNVDEK